MSRKIEDLKWVGGEHDFALYLGEIEALQNKCDAGPEHILRLLVSGDWKMVHLFETIRQGLIGGGMDSAEAKNLIIRLRDDHPLRSFVITAQVVIGAALIGVKDDEVGDKPGETEGETESQNTPEENGSSQPSTETEQS